MVTNLFRCQFFFSALVHFLANVGQPVGKRNLNQFFWLHKLLVGQTWAQTEHIHGLVLLDVGYPLPTKAFIVFVVDFVEDARCGNQ
jgi:hypothetical protein